MLKYCFPRRARLLKAKQYRLVNKQGEEHRGSFLRVHTFGVATGDQKLGITVSRRFGKAVVRNRFKRIVREAFRLSQHDLPSNVHIHVRPLAAAQHATMEMVKEELLSFLSISKKLTLC